MIPILPPVNLFQQFCKHADGWSDHYGCLQVAAAYAGVAMPARYFVKSIWQHGCFGPWDEGVVDMLVYNAPDARRRRVFVAREEMAKVMRESGFGRVQAIGVPMVYTHPSGLPRIPRSLLVMPSHSLDGDTHPDLTPFAKYAKEIKAAAKDFDHVTVCLHPSCRKNGLWVKEFTDCGITIIDGASTNDVNALQRMRALFEQYEVVTTNDWGSHVAYALAFGARVSIFGTLPGYRKENFLRDTSWAKNPQALEQALAPSVTAARHQFLAKFYIPPAQALADQAMGEWLIGHKHKLTPAQMKATLIELADADYDWVASPPTRYLFVSHEASLTGAPMGLLHFLRWLRTETDQGFDILLAKGGPLEKEFIQIGLCYDSSLVDWVKSQLHRYCLVYVNTVCLGELVHKFRGACPRLVTHIHELDSGFDYVGVRQMGMVFKYSSRLICCAENVASRVQSRFGLTPAETPVHAEMIAPAEVRRAAALPMDQRVQSRIPAEARVVVGCGTCDMRKGADLFVQIAGLLQARWRHPQPLRFIWVGRRSEGVFNVTICNDMRRAGLDDCLVWAEEVPNPQAIMARADVFCLTSREDPYPLAMLEGAALGKPIVAFERSGGGPDFCAKGGGLAVPYLDATAMACACIKLLENNELRAAIGKKATELVEAYHTVEKVGPDLFTELTLVASAPPVPVPKLATIFNRWPQAESPAAQPYLDAFRRRSQVIQDARQCVSKGDRPAAISLLIRAVQMDIATNQMPILIEGLVMIGDELAALEPKQSQHLLNEAQRLGLINNLPPAFFRES